MTITSNFPGGNIVVERIDGDDVYLHQDLRDTEGNWFYWYFRAENAGGRTVRFRFTGMRAFTARGPAFSIDQGKNWKWLGAGAVEENGFAYTFAPGENSTLFSMTIPYTGSDWMAYLCSLGPPRPRVEIGNLGFSRLGRPVETMWLGYLGTSLRQRVVLTARHHSCETMGSYALEGLLTHILSDAPEAVRLREHTEFLVIPFVDKDGVEGGDQGKNRHPRDHNRDYDAHPLYSETSALRHLLPTWSQGSLTVALDMHCPWIAEGLNERLYLVGSPKPRIWEQQQLFGKILERVQTGPLRYEASDNLPFGHGWNIAINFQQGCTFCNWLSELPEVRLATTVEVPYANANGGEVNRETARAFGADVARALEQYL
jgi:hypothetical protein